METSRVDRLGRTSPERCSVLLWNSPSLCFLFLWSPSIESELSDFKQVLSKELPNCNVLKETNIHICLDLCIKKITIRTNLCGMNAYSILFVPLARLVPPSCIGRTLIQVCGALMHYINANIYTLMTTKTLDQKPTLH